MLYPQEISLHKNVKICMFPNEGFNEVRVFHHFLTFISGKWCIISTVYKNESDKQTNSYSSFPVIGHFNFLGFLLIHNTNKDFFA